MKVVSLLIERIVDVKPGENFLVISDNHARSQLLAKASFEAAKSRGADVAWVIIKPNTDTSYEPPRSVAAAMKESDVIFGIFKAHGPVHTDARKMATAAGTRCYVTLDTAIPESFWNRGISFPDLEKIRENTDELARRLAETDEARMTSVHGTDVTMRLKGRKGVSIHTLTKAPIISGSPYYAEAAIAPLEGSTEGTLVVDTAVRGWSHFLSKPLTLTIRKGRVIDVSGNKEEVEKLRKIITKDENANNCAAELGIGTCHYTPKSLIGTGQEFGALGYVHIAVGRNNDIGGEIRSAVHTDLCMTNTRVELDGTCVLEKGILKI